MVIWYCIDIALLLLNPGIPFDSSIHCQPIEAINWVQRHLRIYECQAHKTSLGSQILSPTCERAYDEAEQQGIQDTTGKTGCFLKSQQQQRNENKTPLGLLIQISSSLNRHPEMPCVPRDPFFQHFSTLRSWGWLSLVWNAQEASAPHPPIHKNPGREPPSLHSLLGQLPLCSLALPPLTHVPTCWGPGLCSACRCIQPVTVVP